MGSKNIKAIVIDDEGSDSAFVKGRGKTTQAIKSMPKGISHNSFSRKQHEWGTDGTLWGIEYEAVELAGSRLINFMSYMTGDRPPHTATLSGKQCNDSGLDVFFHHRIDMLYSVMRQPSNYKKDALFLTSHKNYYSCSRRGSSSALWPHQSIFHEGMALSTPSPSSPPKAGLAGCSRLIPRHFHHHVEQYIELGECS
jgi:hypothetical protein